MSLSAQYFGYMYDPEEDRMATPQDAEREYAENYGREHPDLAWISTPRDQVMPNPFYVGPPQKHPYDESDEGTDMNCSEQQIELRGQIMEWEDIDF